MTIDLSAIVQAALAALGGGVGVYAAIRADLARVTVVAQVAMESASHAHKRIDGIGKK